MVKDGAKLLPLLLAEAKLENMTTSLSQRELLKPKVRQHLSLKKEH